MDLLAARYRKLFGEALIELGHEKLGEEATLAEIAEHGSSNFDITSEEAKAIVFDAC